MTSSLSFAGLPTVRVTVYASISFEGYGPKRGSNCFGSVISGLSQKSSWSWGDDIES